MIKNKFLVMLIIFIILTPDASQATCLKERISSSTIDTRNRSSVKETVAREALWLFFRQQIPYGAYLSFDGQSVSTHTISLKQHMLASQNYFNIPCDAEELELTTGEHILSAAPLKLINTRPSTVYAHFINDQPEQDEIIRCITISVPPQESLIIHTIETNFKTFEMECFPSSRKSGVFIKFFPQMCIKDSEDEELTSF